MNVRLRLDESQTCTDILDGLARIVQTIGDGWHDWVGPDPDGAMLEAYFKRYAIHRELLQKSYSRALAYPLASHRSVVIVEEALLNGPPPNSLGEETHVSVSVAAVLLSRPLEVIVENEVNDGAFFRRLLGIVDPDLVGLFREARARVRFQNGGGKTVVTRLVDDRADAARAAGIPFRILVLVDSDARYPGHLDQGTKTLRAVCSATGASLLVLQKRAIENYVTDRVLAQYASENPDVAQSVAFILSLPSRTRDHYPIKKGLAALDGKPELPVGPERDLYRDVVFPDFRPRLPAGAERFVSSELVHTKADLKDRDCLDEVEEIARWMRREL